LDLATGYPGKLGLDHLDRRVIELDDVFAGRALEVVVLGGQDEVEALLPPAFVKAAGADQAFLLQPAQRAVDCREIHAGIALVDHGEDFFGGGVAAQAVQRLQDQPALESHPSTLGMQPLDCEIDKSIHTKIHEQLIAKRSQLYCK